MAKKPGVKIRFRRDVAAEVLKAVFLEIDHGISNIKSDAAQNAPADKGNMASRIETRVKLKGNSIEGSLWTFSGYAAHVEFGTGLWGPTKSVIVPKNSKFLVWTSRQSGQTVFARQVVGQPPQPFLKPAIDANVKKIRKAIMNIRDKLKDGKFVTTKVK